MVNSKSSDHEMIGSNPDLEKFHFHQPDKLCLGAFLGKLEVGNVERLFKAFCACIVGTGCFSHFNVILLPLLFKSPLKCLMHTMEFFVGFQSHRFTNFIHLVNKSFTAINHAPINHLTMSSLQTKRSTHCKILMTHIVLSFS